MKKHIVLGTLLFSSVACSSLIAESKRDLDKRVAEANTVVQEIMSAPDGGIPKAILGKATCVGVIPSVKKAAFIVGASYGQGVVTCRTATGWSGPVFIRLAGASFGFQIGGQATDLVLIAVNDKGFQDLLKSSVKLGGDASIAAGPVGRTASADTNILLQAELLSYSRTKGVFAGVDLNGADVSQNSDDTAKFYGGDHERSDILHGNVPAPAASRRFVATVKRYFRSTQN